MPTRCLRMTRLCANAFAPLAYSMPTVLKPRTEPRLPTTAPPPVTCMVLTDRPVDITTGNTLGAKFIVTETLNTNVLS